MHILRAYIPLIIWHPKVGTCVGMGVGGCVHCGYMSMSVCVCVCVCVSEYGTVCKWVGQCGALPACLPAQHGK